MSYRGRVLIINNLVAFSLWHKLAVLKPPPVCSQTWLGAAVLYRTVHEGGQGLVELENRVAAFRRKAEPRDCCAILLVAGGNQHASC